MSFVLDNSVTMRWCFEDGSKKDLVYAFEVLESLENESAVVPDIWSLEVVNVLIQSERMGILSEKQAELFFWHLDQLPVRDDGLSHVNHHGRIMYLARKYHLSAYDAAYFELAIRMSLPLATLDKALIKAAAKAEISIYSVKN